MEGAASSLTNVTGGRPLQSTVGTDPGIVPGTPLENYARCVSPPLSEGRSRARRRRFRRRTILWSQSSLRRVRCCGRLRRQKVVGVRRGPNGAGLSGLVSCGSVWSCPVCNAKVASVRRLEVGAAVAAWMAQGGAVLFMTRTLRHHRGQRLAVLWEGLAGAWRSMLGGEPWRRRRALLGLKGLVRVTETTTGHGTERDNGWHVHVHSLLFVDGAVTDDVVSDFAGWSAARWARSVVAQGLAEPLAVGQDLRVIRDVRDGALSDYLSKMDQGDQISDADRLGLELTHTQSKSARDAYKTRPHWDLLTAVGEGDADALDLWHEWEKASKGRKQVFWSRGFREELLGDLPERSDEDIAEEVSGDEDLVWITPQGWSVLVGRPELIPVMLDAVESSPALLREFLATHRVQYLDPTTAADSLGECV